MKYVNIFIGLCIFFSCVKPKKIEDVEEEDTVLSPSYSRFDITDNDEYELYQDNILSFKLNEASGVVSGRKNPDWVYIHEDSGNGNVVFVYDKSGNYKGYFALTGINNRDWEDIAIGPGPIEGETYIYVADFGDNNAGRSFVRILRFIEPKMDPSKNNLFTLSITDVDVLSYKYPDGPRDAEALLLDPLTKDLMIVTKREPRSHVYTLPYPQSTTTVTTAIFHGTLPFRRVLAGDISPDGKQLLLKDDGAIYRWFIEENNPVQTLFNQVPERLIYIPEVQGEAVGWDNDGKGYFTITEVDKHLVDPILYHYRKKE